MTTSQKILDIRLPINSLDSYMRYVESVPMLSFSEEQALANRLRAENDLSAAKELVLAHARYVVRVARGYKGYGLPLGDLIQEGNIGLMKAVKRFNPDVGVRLVTFAMHWIKSEIHEFVIRHWRIVKIATTKAQRKLFFNLRRMKTQLAWFSNEEVDAVAEDLGVPPQTVREMEMRLSQADVSFDLNNDDDDEDYSAAPATYLEDHTLDPGRIFEKSSSSTQSSEALQQAIASLDERSQAILSARWFESKPTTLEVLAQKYGVSAERIRQLEKNALQKLKAHITASCAT